MEKSFIALQKTALFKQRYEKWYLIDSSKYATERICIEEGAELLLQFLLDGYSVETASCQFGLNVDEIELFLLPLIKEGYLKKVEKKQKSTYQTINPPLDSLNILLTNVCNLNCSHCYVNAGKPIQHELNGKEWIHIFEQAKDIGVFGINVSGGEPTLFKDFVPVCEYLASVHTFNANLNTNATHISDDKINLIRNAFTSVQVSLDDIIPEKHDKFRGRKGAFLQTTNTIRRLIAAGIQTNIGFTLTPDNLNALEGIADFCEKTGICILNIGFVAEVGRAKDKGILHRNGKFIFHNDIFMEKIYKKLQELATRTTSLVILLPFRIGNMDTGTKKEKRFICDGDNNQILYILADGTAIPCDKLPISVFGAGNLKEQSLVKIWTSEKMHSFKLMSPRQLSKCSTCEHLTICGGACVARAFQAGGSLNAPELTSCLLTQKIIKNT